MTLLMADSERKLEELLDKQVKKKKNKKKGLIISCKQKETNQVSSYILGMPKFNYLDSGITDDGKCA